MSKFEDGSSYSKRQRVITNQIPDQNSAMKMNYGRQRLKHEAHQKGSLSYHTNTWYQSGILHHSLTTGRKIRLKTTMDQQEHIYTVNGSTILGK